MKQLSVFSTFVVFSFMVLWACTKNDNNTPAKKDNATVINEAKSYFKNEVAPTSPGRTVNIESGQSIVVDNYPVWEEAKVISDTFSQQTVIVPLLASYKYVSVKQSIKIPLLTKTSLVIYRDKENKQHAEIKVRLPDNKNNALQFSGLVLFQKWDGNPLRSLLLKDGKLYNFSSNGIKNNPVVVETTAPTYLCYDIDYYTCVSSGGIDFGCTYNYTTTHCDLVPGSSGGGGAGGGTGTTGSGGGGGGTGSTGAVWSYPPVIKPGDRLCPSSFNYTNQSQTGAFYLTNMIGMRVEDGANAHTIPPTVFSLTNGITDAAMKGTSGADYWDQGKSSIQYLKDMFPTLFPIDIRQINENGKLVWHFSPKAAAIISAFVTNFAGIVVASTIPGAALPGNPATDGLFFQISDLLIKTYMPGSSIFPGSRPTATMSYATYQLNCRW